MPAADSITGSIDELAVPYTAGALAPSKPSEIEREVMVDADEFAPRRSERQGIGAFYGFVKFGRTTGRAPFQLRDWVHSFLIHHSHSINPGRLRRREY